MEETTATQSESNVEVEATQAPQEELLTEPQAPATPEEQLNALINRRMGEFSVKISYPDLKYIKNTIQQKVEWKGPNEAYLVIISLLTIDNALQAMDPKSVEAIQIHLPSSTIESINFFLNRITGKGLDSAQKLFSISMMLRQPIEALKKLDNEIETLRAEVEKTEKNA
jgi:hypothetical protein